MKIAVAQIITRMLNIADHTIVPAPILSLPAIPPNIVNSANIEVKSSGALLPMAMNVAPVTSDDIWSFSDIFSNEITKKSSDIIARR